MAFDVQGALKAGYSPAEIADFLGAENNFDVAGARKAGYRDDELLDHLSGISAAKKKPEPEKPGIIARASETAVPTGDAMGADVGSEIMAVAGPKKASGYRSVLEDVQPTAAQQQADVNKRLSYGAGPVSQATVAKADAMRMGTAPVEAGPALTVAKARAAEGAETFAQTARRVSEADALEAEAERMRRQAFAEENPILGSAASGAASTLSGVINAPSTAAAFTNETIDSINGLAVNPVLQAMGLKPLARLSDNRVPTAFGTEYLARAASDFMPAVGRQEMDSAFRREEFGQWLGSKLAANSIPMAQSLAALYAAPLRAVLLPGMGATAAGQSYAGGDAASVAAAKGLVEVGTEMLPLKVFDKVSEALKGLSPAKQSAVLAIAGQRLLQAGGQQGVNQITNAIEETAAQFGGNVLDKYFQGKDVDLSKGLAEAAVVGAVSGGAMALPQTGQILKGAYDPNAQIAQAINENVAGTEFTSAQPLARDLLNPNTYDASLISPTRTVDTSKISQAATVDDAIAAAQEVAGEVNAPAPAFTAPVPAALGQPVIALGPMPLPVAADGRIEPTFDVNAPLAPEPLAATTRPTVSSTLPRLTERAPDVDLLSRVEAQTPGLVAPRPQKIQGVAVSQLSDDQLKSIAADESVPAITRRGASVELTARQTQAPAPTPLAGPATPPSVPLPNVPAIADKTLVLPASEVAVPAGPAAPVGGESAAEGARATAQAALDRWAAASGVTVPAQLNPAPADRDAAVNAIAQALNSQFGGRIYAYSDTSPGNLNGIAIGRVGFVNTADVVVNVGRTSLHEFKHTVEQIATLEKRQGLTDTPAQKFVASIDSIFDDMTDAGKAAYLENFLAKDELAGITDPAARQQRLQELMQSPDTRSEMTADFLGNRATDKRFWKDVAKADPAGFKGFVDRWLSIIDNMLDVLKGKRTQSLKESAQVDRYVRDLNKAKAVARDALIEYNRTYQGAQNGSVTTAGNAGVSGPAASARPEPAGAGSAQVPEYGIPREGAVSVLGRHYSTETRTALSGAYYGRGLKGAERDRLDSSPDPRLKNRIYFYVDQGSGVRPESGVGGFAHEVQLNNIYDPETRLVKSASNLNAWESAVINAGFDGYIAPFGTNQSAVVLLGTKHQAVPVRALGRVAAAAPVEKAAPTVLKKGLMSKEVGQIDTSRIPGAQVRMGNLEIPADQREAANAELERIGSSARFSQRETAAPAAADPVTAASLAETLKLAQGQSWARGRDLKMAMQQRVLDAAMAKGLDVTADNAETREYLREVATLDALAALKQNANAIGWYDLKTRQALSVMALVHPEIAKNQDARFAFTWALAVTSNGLKVGKNFELAEKVYEAYKKTGRMPTNIGIGTAGNAINDSLRLFNELRVTWGADNLRKFMQTDFTVSEITGISKALKPGGEHADVTVKGAAILGPKIGNGFFSNLYGNFDSLTMDRWLVRTWGRWTGTLIKPMPEQTAKARDRLSTALDVIVKSPDEAKRLGTLVDLPITKDTDVDALATAVQEASMDPGIRAQMNETEAGLELRKAGNSLAKYLDGQKEAPQGPTERKFIRAIFSDVLADLQQRPEYQELTMADLQAVLWYAEKRLYETAKEDPNADEDIEGYADDDAPDYANAAADVARQKGVPDTRIKAALKKEERNERPTGTRPAAEPSIAVPPAVAAGKPPAVGGFAGREKRRFIGERAVLRARADRASDGQQSPAFAGDGGTDGGRVRVLKSLGVSYTQKWKATRETATVFRANGLPLPIFVELAPTAQNAEQFQKAISDSKANLKFGAAVYVYPAEDYQGMKLFLAEDGQSGVAVKPDGDIVSVFSTGGAGRAVMELAVAAGGRKLDAFDTVLPEFYAPHGFKAVARTSWNDDFAPEGWSKETFSEFNNGQPDVVFMAYDAAKANADYSPKDGTRMTGGDAYDQAVARQNRETRKVAKAPKAATIGAEGLFAGLDKRGLAKSRAEAAVAAREDAAEIQFIQENFLDILSELDDSGRVKINCD